MAACWRTSGRAWSSTRPLSSSSRCVKTSLKAWPTWRRSSTSTETWWETQCQHVSQYISLSPYLVMFNIPGFVFKDNSKCLMITPESRVLFGLCSGCQELFSRRQRHRQSDWLWTFKVKFLTCLYEKQCISSHFTKYNCEIIPYKQACGVKEHVEQHVKGTEKEEEEEEGD